MLKNFRKNEFLIFTLLIFGGWYFCFLGVRSLNAIEFLPTSVQVTLSCGDGLAEGLEVCDPGQEGVYPPDTGTSTCTDFFDIFGNPFASGALGCETDCSDYASSTCYTCGNAYKELEEECDGIDYGGRTCLTYGFIGGSLICTVGCHISLSGCVAPEEEGGTAGSGSSGGNSAGSFMPGSLTAIVTKVIIRGKSYPDSDVHILIDGTTVGIVTTDAKADFYFETADVTPGVASFGFWSEDKEGLKSTLLTLTFRVISGAVTTISGVYIAPSIDVDKKSVVQGEPVVVYGQTVPDTEVHVHINSEQEYIEQTSSKDDGAWSLIFNTNVLEDDFHTAKALFQIETLGNVIKSGFSKSVSFYVGRVGGEAACPNADLNKDGSVNLTDFSILLFNWGTDNACADQNQNGTVDLIDFSIMLYYWTG